MSTFDLSTPASPGAAITLEDLQGSAARRRRDSTVKWLFLGSALLSIVISALIVFTLVGEAWKFLSSVDLAKLLEVGWFPRRGLYDVRTLIVSSLLVTAVAMAIAVPLGLGAAIYLAEYAPRRARRMLKPIIEVLAGIPSVVLGFFALQWISPEVVQRFFPDANTFNLLAAGIGVGILTVPLVASISEDALTSVPHALREAAVGVGARKREVTVRVVLPAAVSGLVAAFIVGVSRAIGETMVVAVAAGGSGGSLFSTDITEPGLTMTAAMASLAAGTDQVKGASDAFQSLFFVGIVLFATTLVLNSMSERFVRRVRQRY